MKKATVTTLGLVVLVLFVCFVWFSQSYTSTVTNQDNNPGTGGQNNVINNVATSAATNSETTPVEVHTNTTENITVDTSSLGDGQQQLLQTLGIEGEIEITPEMQRCAEEKIGTERLDEIINGATPSFAEGLSLARCY